MRMGEIHRYLNEGEKFKSRATKLKECRTNCESIGGRQLCLELATLTKTNTDTVTQKEQTQRSIKFRGVPADP